MKAPFAKNSSILSKIGHGSEKVRLGICYAEMFYPEHEQSGGEGSFE